MLQPRAIGAAHYCTAVGTLASPLSSLAGAWSQERERGGCVQSGAALARGCLQEEDQRSGNAAPVVLFQSRARASGRWSPRNGGLRWKLAARFTCALSLMSVLAVSAANSTTTIRYGFWPCARSLPVALFFSWCVSLSVSVPLSLHVAPCLGFFLSWQISKIAQTLNNCQPFGCAN